METKQILIDVALGWAICGLIAFPKIYSNSLWNKSLILPFCIVLGPIAMWMSMED